MPHFTTEELIRYVYKETSVKETAEIEKALKTDWDLKEKLDAISSSINQLDTILTSPRQQSVMAILNYAKTSSEVEQP